MSNLVRQRRAHDLWISRSHLYAYGASAALAVLTAFGAGFVAGRSSVDVPAAPPAELASATPDRQLVELLARVDAAATPDGGVRDLTFPDTLTGEAGDGEVPQPPEEPGAVGLPGVPAALPERGDVPPHGRWTLTAASVPDREEADRLASALRERDLAAWVAPEQLDGETRYRVGVGGWGSKSEAEEALEKLRAQVSIEGAPVLVTRY
ncbi:MAG: SPOR domain-containing protein [Alphaproteobacteria bacterium]|nr:SPOR domain-containing protein [Alphaproteobacteria bacterium]